MMPQLDDRYERVKERARQTAADISRSGREIGPLPQIEDIARRNRCSLSLVEFCQTYFPNRFHLSFGASHLASIKLQSQVIRDGGQFAYALPRGEGKTTICEVAVLWATLYGYRRYVVLIGASEIHAVGLLDSIKGEIESNDLLLADFPEVCHPVRALEGIIHRSNGQILNGSRTQIEWTDKSVSYPRIPDSVSSGTLITAVGITGTIRGMSSMREGRKVRPDLVVLDDPQTDESARSPTQNLKREQTISGAVLGLAGPRKRIAAIMPATVICRGDMVDQILDRSRHPEWHGVRYSMLQSMPRNLEMWRHYYQILTEAMREDRGRESATEYYRANREEMDAGASVSWDARYDADQISAIQHAMERYLTDPHSFAAEYQNVPLDLVADSAVGFTSDSLSARLSRLDRGVIPHDCVHLTAAIDVQKHLLYYTVVAWDAHGGGAVVDYGTYPEQESQMFTAADPPRPLSRVYPQLPSEAAIYAGLTELVSSLISRQWSRSSGGSTAIDQVLVDSGWHTDLVYRWVRSSPHGSLVLASKGVYTGAAGRAIGEWTMQAGDRVGDIWRLRAATAQHRMRLMLYDTNAAKTRLAERLSTPLGVHSALLLHGSDPRTHTLFFDHLLSEYPVRVKSAKREVDEWKIHPGRPDNHWLDTTVGCLVAASYVGVRVGAATIPDPIRPASIKLSEMQRNKRGKR